MAGKVLIISYYWPPSGGAGVQRWLKFVKYLREYGWEAVVYTPSNPEYPEQDESLLGDIPEGITVLRQPIWEPYSAYKRVLGLGKGEKISAGFLTEEKKPGIMETISVWIRGNFFIPDARKFWIKPSIRYLTRFLHDHPVDVMVTTGPPHSCHLIGLGVKQKTGLPWVADFRDPWTGIDFYQDLKLTSWADRKHHNLEIQVLTEANRVIMISPSQAESFTPIYDRKYDVITNGFDTADYQEVQGMDRDPYFSLAHIGSLVPGRNPHMLWQALEELCGSIPGFADDLVIKLVGKTDYTVMESIGKAGLSTHVHKIDYLSHDKVVQEQYRTQVLLLLINQTPNAASILTGKFFEYLAVSRPILCIGPVDGNAAAILRETGAGQTAGFGDKAGMIACITAYYQMWKAGTLHVQPAGIGKYSRKALTGQLAGILDEVLSSPSL